MSLGGLIGVVHARPMPGDPACREDGFDAVFRAAMRDAEAIVEGGADALIVENFGSAPFPKGTPEQPTPPHQIALLTRIVDGCIGLGKPVGVNVLRNDGCAALGIAAATGARFVRVNIHVGAYVTDQGLIEGRAFETLRYRQALDARHVAILADVRVKHATPLAPVSIETEVSDLLRRGLADALVVTGPGTGQPVSRELLERVRACAPDATVLVGSGMSPEQTELAKLADGAIVGTWLKEGGHVSNPVDATRVAQLASGLDFRTR